VLSADESSIYVVGASYDFFCLESAGGRETWTDFGARSVHLAEPKLWENNGDSVVYAIESLNGNVRQHDTSTGDRNWEFSCADLTGVASCQDQVEGEFR
jgi:outer membrane protein assembly factor BamB